MRAGQTLAGTEIALLDSPTVWIGFNLFIVALLVLDLLILNRRDHVVGLREAGILTVFWTLVAAGVAVWIYVWGATEQGTNYVTAYIVERALSVDNLFVFLVIFGFFRLPVAYQSRGLLFGIVGALIARALFIGIGTAAIQAFAWVLIPLGIFLVYTAYKLAFVSDHEVDPNKNLAVRLFRRFMPVSEEYDGHKFFTRINGVRAATPFLMVVVALGTTDVVFAVDSIPTVFGITDDPFIVWSSNAMAVLGMRPLFFLLAGLVDLFRYLQYGLAVILGFIGLKMIVEEGTEVTGWWHMPEVLHNPLLSLAVILGVLGGSVLLSKLIPDKSGQESEQHAATDAAND